MVRARQEKAIDLGGHPGLLVRPRDARALYVLAHGAGAGMRHAFLATMASALADRDIATLRWEFPYMASRNVRGEAASPRPNVRGEAASPRPNVRGEAASPRKMSRPDRAEVAEAAVRVVWTAARRSFARTLPMFAGGKSFGGRMTSRAHAAAPLDGLRGLVFLGFPLHPPDKPGTERAEHLADAAGPLLFLQGTRDDLADLALLRPVVRRLGARATLHVVDGADHGFDVLVRSGRTPADVFAELADTAAAWMARHAAV